MRSPGSRTDFENLNDSQRSYYLWYRQRFMDGGFPASDIGYSRLLLIELINDRRDPPRIMEALWHYREAQGRDSRSYPDRTAIDEAMFCYALANDLRIPCIGYPVEEWSRAAVSETLLPYPEAVTGDLLGLVTGGASDRGNARATALFNASLPAVGRRLRTATGKGILETYGTGERTLVVEMFGDPASGNTICTIPSWN